MAKRNGAVQVLGKGTPVKKLPVPDEGSRIFWDSEVGGFGARIWASGKRSYILDYRVKGSGRQRRYTIGDCADWPTGAARIEARRLRRIVDENGDPMGTLVDEREAATMGDLADRFEKEHLTRKLRASTAGDYKAILKNHIRPHFGKMKVDAVEFADVDKLHAKITKAGSPYTANRTVAVLSKMFSLSIRWKMRTDNPARGVERNAETKRTRYMTGEELQRLVQALATFSDQQTAAIIRVLLLTGCRRGEALGMRWADLDLGNGIWSKPGSTTKQKSDHVVPLSAPVRQLLSEIEQKQLETRRTLPEFVFATGNEKKHRVELKNGWAAVCKAADIKGLRMHDLRHSFASQLVSAGASLPLIGALLGHSTAATTHRYSHMYVDPQRAAAEKVASIITAAGGDVEVVEPTPLRPRRR